MSTNHSSDIILKTEGLTKHYGGLYALEDANFELKRGEHVAIMGDNGAGKSTFVRQITGVEQRTRGRVLFDGHDVHFKGPLEAREAGIKPCSKTSLWRMILMCRRIFFSGVKSFWLN